MLHLLQLEWKKIIPNRAFKIAIGMYLVLLPLLFFTIKSAMRPSRHDMEQLAIIETLYKFPNIWDTVSYWASWLTFFLLVYLAVWMVTSEYSQKTMRQNLITGMERRSYLMGKLIMMASLNLGATLYMASVAGVLGHLAGGYGDPFGHEIYAIGRFFVQNMFYMSFAFMLAILLKRSGLAMIMFFAYVLIVERVIRYLVFLNLLENLRLGSYFPASAAWDVVPMYMVKKVPNFMDDDVVNIILSYDTATGLTIGYTALFLFIAYRVFMSRDL